MTKRLVSDRMVVKKADLEKKLTAYLRKAGRCIDAGSVQVAAVTPTAEDQPNWAIAAVNYGRAPKAECDEELTRIAPLFLRHFNIAPDMPADAEDTTDEATVADQAIA